MQMFVLLLFVGLFLIQELDGRIIPASAGIDGWILALLFLAPKLALVGIYWLLCRLTYNLLDRAADTRAALLWLEVATHVFRGSILALYALDLVLGVPAMWRDLLNDPLLIDEIMVIAPPLAMIIFSWWAWYPIDRRLREAQMMRKLDAGQAVHTVWTRGQFVLAQVRFQLVLMLAPMLLLTAWYEIVKQPALELVFTYGGRDVRPLAMGGGALVILALSPLLLRHLWDTAPLPAGELRDRLQRMCEQHRVGVRDLLLWRTFGGMVNGAVMGFVGRVRYILLTDALLDALPIERIEAVMAHELAHVRRHHMFWLLIVAGSTMLGMQLAWGLGMNGAAALTSANGGPIPLPASLDTIVRDEQTLMELGLLPALVCWFALFGWVSRRFERQADTFAVQHLAREQAQLAAEASGDQPPPDRRIHVDNRAAGAMISALQQVAELNHMNVGRPTFLQKLTSWRHGTIPWRQDYLRGLVGQPIDRLSIDRQVRWIKFASGAAFALIAGVLLGPLSGVVGL